MRLVTPRTALLAAAFGFAPAALAQPEPPPTPTPPGQPIVDGTLTDAAYTLLATDTGGPGEGSGTRGFGDFNQLNAIYAHADSATGRLAIGVAGILERNDNAGARNYIVVFLDTRAGGFGGGNFGRTNGPDGAGVTNFNNAVTFDAGFTADYALQIGCSNTDCSASLFTLAGTADTGGGSTLVLGTNADADVEVVLPADQNSRTQGAEVSLSFSADGAGADLALDRHSVQAFALIIAGGGFVSNQFLTPAGSDNGNYGGDGITFEQAPPDPVSYVFQRIAGRKGWRQLAWPVVGGTVADYAAQNHVQGPGTAFPGGGSNVILRYAPAGYEDATGSANALPSGRGQFWYHYDAADFAPNAPAAGFQPLPYTLEAGGVEPQADVQASFDELEAPGQFVMAGNPFSLDFDVQGVSAAGGFALAPLVYVWNPDFGAAGGYAEVDRNDPDTADRTVAPMQGMWLQGSLGAPPFQGGSTLTFAQASRVQSNEPILARTAAQRVLGFRLDRLTDAGPVAEWRTARLAFVDGATDGADAFDAGLPPGVPGGAEARVAFVGDGPADYRGQDSRPYEPAGRVEAALALLVSGRPANATYRLTWPTMDDVPAEWALTLTDGDTGESVDLRTAGHLDFVASPADWTARFTVAVDVQVVAGEGAPAVVRLGAPAPNPSSTEARLALTVDRAQAVRADLYDALGRHVAVVFDGSVEAARDLAVDTRGLAPGVYVLRVVGDTFAAARRVTVAR